MNEAQLEPERESPQRMAELKSTEPQSARTMAPASDQEPAYAGRPGTARLLKLAFVALVVALVLIGNAENIAAGRWLLAADPYACGGP